MKVMVADSVQADMIDAKPSVIKAYRKQIAQLESMQLSQGAHLERLKGCKLFSLRLTRKARLLLCPVMISNKPAWYVSQVLLNHEYHKVRQLTKQTLDGLVDDGGVDDGAAEAVAAAPTGDSRQVLAVTQACMYNGMLVDLSVTQQRCIDELVSGLCKTGAFIGLVAGTPGSGKTLLASELLKRVMQVKVGVSQCIYLAQSRSLRNAVKEQWSEAAEIASSDQRRCTVRFCTYENILQRFGLLGDIEAVEDGDLEQYYAGIKRTHVRLNRNDALARVSYRQFFQECVVMSVAQDLKAYQSVGSAHSMFHGKADMQAMLWRVFCQYRDRLRASSKYHPQFTAFEVTKPMTNVMIVVDEALDLSRSQLRTLINLGVKLVLLGDYNQDLTHVSHSMEYLKQLVQKQSALTGCGCYVAKLDKSYRCSAGVVAVANAVLRIKKKVLPHGSELADAVIESAFETAGDVRCALMSDVARLKEQCRSPDTAVICAEGAVEAAKSVLNTVLVFTVDSIKGLEYRRIILWDFISASSAKSLLAIMRRAKVDRDSLSADDKILIDQLNALFTAVTRAEVELVFMQASHKPNPVVKQLIDELTRDVVLSVSESKSDDVAVEDSANDWVNEAIRLLAYGNVSVAMEVLSGLVEEKAWLNTVKRMITTGRVDEALVLLRRGGLPPTVPDRTEGVAVAERKEDVGGACSSAAMVAPNGEDAMAVTFRLLKRGRKRRHASSRTIDFSKYNHATDFPVLQSLGSSELSKVRSVHVAALLGAVIPKGQAFNADACVALLKRLKLDKSLKLDEAVKRVIAMQASDYGAVLCRLMLKFDGRKFLYRNVPELLFAFAEMHTKVAKLLKKAIAIVVGDMAPEMCLLLVGSDEGAERFVLRYAQALLRAMKSDANLMQAVLGLMGKSPRAAYFTMELLQEAGLPLLESLFSLSARDVALRSRLQAAYGYTDLSVEMQSLFYYLLQVGSKRNIDAKITLVCKHDWLKAILLEHLTLPCVHSDGNAYALFEACVSLVPDAIEALMEVATASSQFKRALTQGFARKMYDSMPSLMVFSSLHPAHDSVVLQLIDFAKHDDDALKNVFICSLTLKTPADETWALLLMRDSPAVLLKLFDWASGDAAIADALVQGFVIADLESTLVRAAFLSAARSSPECIEGLLSLAETNAVLAAAVGKMRIFAPGSALWVSMDKRSYAACSKQMLRVIRQHYFSLSDARLLSSSGRLFDPVAHQAAMRQAAGLDEELMGVASASAGCSNKVKRQ